ncbi:MAG TPA: hypothetical protein VGL23_00520, partial [Chloroflexota bacterium]|jgi:hypothetical protein
VAAIALFVVYLVGQAASQLASDAATATAWQRATWWGAHGAVAAWLGLVVALRTEETHLAGAAALVGLAALAVPVAILLAAAGSATDVFFVWGSPVATEGGWRGPAGALYPVYGLAVVGGVVAAAVLARGAWLASPPDTPVRARLGWLFAAGLLFTAGAAALVAYRFVGRPADALGLGLLLIGTAVMGWNVARYGALVAGEVIGPDFVAFAVGQALVVAFYGAFAWTTGLARGRLDAVLVAMLALMTTHVMAGNRTLWLDRVLFGRLAGELGALSLRVARQPDPESALAEAQTTVDALVAARAEAPAGPASPADAAALERRLRVPVEAALRRVNDLAFLSRSPLIEQLPWVASHPGTALDRARALQESLLDALEKLRPPGPRPLPGQSAASAPWLLYLSLLECCVEGRQIKEFDQRWHISESSYHRTRRSATEAVVRELAGRVKG